MDKHPSKAEWISSVLDRFEAPLLRYAARFTTSEAEARDVVQDTFLKLCQARRSDVENHLAPWLYRVCRNRAIDIRRKEKRVQSLPEATEQRLVSADPAPDSVMEQKQGRAQILAVVDLLPPKQREVVELRFQSGLSYKEISEVTGSTVSNVGVLIHTAVKRIRDKLSAAEVPMTGKATAGGAK
jgi:RNA polymerase sigma-70 factor (ECF subfamily)